MTCCWRQGQVVIDEVGVCGGVAVGRDWERRHGGKDILVCGHLDTCEVVDGVTSATAEFDLGKLTLS